MRRAVNGAWAKSWLLTLRDCASNKNVPSPAHLFAVVIHRPVMFLQLRLILSIWKRVTCDTRWRRQRHNRVSFIELNLRIQGNTGCFSCERCSAAHHRPCVKTVKFWALHMRMTNNEKHRGHTTMGIVIGALRGCLPLTRLNLLVQIANARSPFSGRLATVVLGGFSDALGGKIAFDSNVKQWSC